MSAAAADWSLPATWLAEHDTARRVAASLRAEADLYRHEAAKRAAAGDEAAHNALRLSMWHVISQAAAIERGLRGLPKANQ